MRKRILISMLLFGTVLLAASCRGTDVPPPAGGTDTPATDTLPAVPQLMLWEGGASEYSIVRAELAGSGSAALTEAKRLREAFRETVGDAPKIATDFVQRGAEIPVGTKEILIGETNRPESLEVLASLEGLAYAIRAVNGRIVIAATSDAMLKMAVDAFIAEYLPSGASTIAVPEDLDMTYTTDRLRPSYDAAHAEYKDEKLHIYPVASCYALEESITVTVNGHRVPLHSFTELYDYCAFAVDGKAEISVTMPEEIKKCTVSPLRFGYEAKTDGKTVTFTMEKPEYLILDLDQSAAGYDRRIVIAADPLETDVPDPSAPGVYCITDPKLGGADPTGVTSAQDILQSAINEASKAGGGIVYVPDGIFTIRQLKLQSNVSIYLAPGAVLRADDPKNLPVDYRRAPSAISTNGKMDGTFLLTCDPSKSYENIRIYGRGTIDGTGLYLLSQYRLSTPVHPVNVDGFTMEGITVRDGAHWSTMPVNCKNVTIENTKHLNDISPVSSENDAIDIVCSQDVVIRHVLAFSEDDAISAKSYTKEAFLSNEGWMGSLDSQDNKNILVEDCTVWSVCGGLKIGWGVGMNTEDVIFRNCTVYRAMTALDVTFRHGSALVSNIVFEDIDVEGFSPRIVTGKTYKTRFFMIQSESETGHGIDGVVMRNINVRAQWSAGANFKGASAISSVRNVLFENITLRGKKVAQMSTFGSVGNFVENAKLISN